MGREILSLSPPVADKRLGYGPEALHFGDLRLPKADGPHPVVVSIHGGFWRSLYGLDYMGHIAADLTSRGLATWNIEYRRIGDEGGGWPNTFLDAARATDFLRELAPAYNLDLGRVMTLGHSAGGHLACWLGGRHHIPATEPLHTPDPLPLYAAISLAGVLDLQMAWQMGLSERVVETFLGGSPSEVPDRYRWGSPAALLPLGIRQLLVHGTADEPVPYGISQSYHGLAVAQGDDVALLTLAGTGHFEVVDPRSDEWPQIREAVLALLDRA